MAFQSPGDLMQNLETPGKPGELGVCKTRNPPGTYRNHSEPTRNHPKPPGTTRNQPGTTWNPMEPTLNPPESWQKTQIIKKSNKSKKETKLLVNNF